MTNGENIRNMTDEELCDYIYSVFLTGKYYGQLERPVEDAPDYMKWLKSPVKDLEDVKRESVKEYVENFSKELPISFKELAERYYE